MCKIELKAQLWKMHVPLDHHPVMKKFKKKLSFIQHGQKYSLGTDSEIMKLEVAYSSWAYSNSKGFQYQRTLRPSK